MTLSNLFSLQWWTAVGVALLIWAVVSDVFKKILYAALGKVSSHYRVRAEANEARLYKRACAAADNPLLHTKWVRNEWRSRQVAIYYMVAAGVVVGFYSPVHGLSAENPNPVLLHWPANVTSQQLGILTLMVVMYVLTFLSSISWGRAGYYGKVVKLADDILFERSLKSDSEKDLSKSSING